MDSRFVRAFFSRPVALRACRVACVVAPILLLVNHFELVVDAPFGSRTLRQLGLNFLVPYMVSSYSSAQAAIRRGESA